MPPTSPNRHNQRIAWRVAVCQGCPWSHHWNYCHGKSATTNAARLHNEATGHTVVLQTLSVTTYRGPQLRRTTTSKRFTQPLGYVPTNPDPTGARFK